MIKVIVLAALFLTSSIFPQQMTDLEKLVETERAFARMAAEKSTKEAFLHFLADDGIVFESGPVNGKEAWRKRPPSVGLLSWEPVWADVSADGSIGYTTGPWEFRPTGKDGDPVAFGQYVTVWKKQKDGEFRFVLDIGISHGKHEGPAPKISYAAMAGKAGPAPKEFLGPGEDVSRWIGAEARLYRDGVFPVTGEGVMQRLKAEKGGIQDGAVCEGETDFRYCYGSRNLSFEDGEVKGNFFQIHRYHSGEWQIALDLFTKVSGE